MQPEPFTSCRPELSNWSGCCYTLRSVAIMVSMTKKKLGNSDLEITPIGVGAWAMGGGGWAFSWGPQDDNESIAAIRAAFDKGVNWIDTAAVYGLGHSEEVVARAVEGISPRPLCIYQVRAGVERGNVRF